MKTNGMVRRLAASPLGFERWEAKCLLCAWRSRERMYASKSAAVPGNWDALEHYSQVEPEETSGRRARTASRQSSAWFRHAIHSREILPVILGFIDAS
jgi:hypothetical protein